MGEWPLAAVAPFSGAGYGGGLGDHGVGAGGGDGRSGCRGGGG